MGLMSMINSTLAEDAQFNRWTKADESIISNIRDRIKNAKAKKTESAADKLNGNSYSDVVNALYDSKYKPLLLDLQKKVTADVMARKAKLPMAISAEEDGNVYDDGSVGCIVFHWQSLMDDFWNDMDKYPKALQALTNGRYSEVSSDDGGKYEAAAMDWVEKQLFNDAISKYASTAKKINPNCKVELLGEDVDLLFIKFDKSWIENEVPKAPAEEHYTSMSASDFLAAYESHQALKAEMENPTSAIEEEVERIHQGLEDSLSKETAPYDPTEELENVAQTLAGIDDPNGIEPNETPDDKPLDGSENIENLMATPTDTENAEGSAKLD